MAGSLVENEELRRIWWAVVILDQLSVPSWLELLGNRPGEA